MCFSATASFAASAALFPAGVYCVHSALRKKQRAFLPLAAVPILLSAQQCGEGLVWFGLDHHQPALARTAALGVLFFAIWFWVFWIPLSVLVIEPRPRVRQTMALMVFLGLVFGSGLYGPIFLDPEHRLQIEVVHHSIDYDCSGSQSTHPIPKEVWHLIYLSILCSPLLISHTWGLKYFAITLVVSAIVSHFMFWYAFESVWCFFAAVLSFQLCLVFYRLPESAPRAVDGTLATVSQ